MIILFSTENQCSENTLANRIIEIPLSSPQLHICVILYTCQENPDSSLSISHLQELSREVEEGRRDAEERRSRSRGVVVEDDGAGLVIEEATGDLPARIAEMESEIRTLREANKSECANF